MELANQKNNNNYTLSSGSGSRKDVLNYSHQDYNNYHSWSNVARGHINLSSVDENSQVNTVNFPFSRLQPLAAPFMTYGDTTLSWAPVDSVHAKPVDKYLQKN